MGYLRHLALGVQISTQLHGKIKNVRICIRKLCKALEEDSFRPVLHHYDSAIPGYDSNYVTLIHQFGCVACQTLRRSVTILTLHCMTKCETSPYNCSFCPTRAEESE